MRLSVAPMEGVTTFPMRLWLHLASRPKSMTTPFIRATNVFPEAELPFAYAPELFQLRGVLPYELTPQILAAEPENFLRTAELLPETVAPYVEINCGCPSPNSAGRNAGSGILRDPDVFGRIVASLSAALGAGRLAVKMRLGFAAPEEFDQLLPHVASLPLARLTVHGRTRADGYRGKARWDLIEKAGRTAISPTWASGDVVDGDSFAQLRDTAPSVVGVMIGRGILYNPWIFEELANDQAVDLASHTLLDALVVYALLNELWITAPEKLVARVGKGKLNDYCGTSPAAWSDVAATLTSMVFGVPFVPSSSGIPVDAAISPTSMSRLRYVWQHLRQNLPDAFHTPKLSRAKTLEEFVAIFRTL